jgi:HEXXH motif-containing protein
LFDDLDIADHFPSDLPTPENCSTKLAAENVLAALEMIRAFCPAIYNDLLAVVRTVAIVPHLADRMRHSFSCRHHYYGGIFLCLDQRPVAFIAEDLIHEYYHQRFWGWWLLENWGSALKDMPKVTSPITHRPKDYGVMLQAAYIYRSSIEFLEHAYERAPCCEQKPIKARLSELRSGYPMLLNRLRTPLHSYKQDVVAALVSTLE